MSRENGPVTVGFDIGGTNLRGAVVAASGTVIDFEQVPTPSSTDALEQGIQYIVNKLRQRHDIAAVGVAVAAFLDSDCTTVRFAPHLPWRDAAVQERLQNLLQVPVRLEHDANAAAWGEYRFGAARSATIWTLFAIGTGIGGALMINGQIYRGAYGTAPEFGHLTVIPDGRICPCGKRGCLERYCSGTALVATAREIIASGRFPDARLSIDYHDRPEALTGHIVMQSAHRGDEAARAAVADFAYWLGEGLAIVSDILDPELIVIGGGVAGEAMLYLDEARSHFSRKIVGAGHRPLPELRIAELGSDAGMIGVADLARQLA
ncbi:MAG: ROK family protein [Corynebacterium sp.]|nr:ROK family protein [Corynebacterium sp.]